VASDRASRRAERHREKPWLTPRGNRRSGGVADADDGRRPTGQEKGGAGRQPPPRHARDTRRSGGSDGQRPTARRHGVTRCRAHGRTAGGSGRLGRPARGVAAETRRNGAARGSRGPPATARWGAAPRSQGRGASQGLCGRGDGGRPVLGMRSAAEAGSTPSSAVWMPRQGAAPTCRAHARQGAPDRGRTPEEPCEGATLRHGSEPETGGVIPSSTVTGRLTASAALRLSGAAEAQRVCRACGHARG
jgi:hypothetical protein